MLSKLHSAHFCYFLRLLKCHFSLKTYVYIYEVPLAIIQMIITLYFSKENDYGRCVVMKMCGVHWLNAVFLHCEEENEWLLWVCMICMCITSHTLYMSFWWVDSHIMVNTVKVNYTSLHYPNTFKCSINCKYGRLGNGGFWC